MASAGLLHPQVDVYPMVLDAGGYRPGPDELQLWATEKIFNAWPDPPPDHKFQVYVSLPTYGEYFIRLSLP